MKQILALVVILFSVNTFASARFKLVSGTSPSCDPVIGYAVQDGFIKFEGQHLPASPLKIGEAFMTGSAQRWNWYKVEVDAAAIDFRSQWGEHCLTTNVRTCAYWGVFHTVFAAAPNNGLLLTYASSLSGGTKESYSCTYVGI